MCPACITTAALWLAGTTSAGGLVAFVASKRRAGRDSPVIDPKPSDPNTPTEGERNESAQGRITH
jgi:hypothetical protein